jgi:TonB family protein
MMFVRAAAVAFVLGITISSARAESRGTWAQPAMDVPADAVWSGCPRHDHGPWPAYRDRARVRDGPRLIQAAAYEYPTRAAKLGVVGTVTVAALVCEHGYVVEARVLRSIPGLDDAALTCVRRWEFEPATRRGRPVACWTEVPVEFVLPMDSWSDDRR